MRMTRTFLILMGLSTSFAVPAHATEGVLRVKCEWRQSTDMQSLRTEKVTGSSEFIYDPVSDLTGTMAKEGLDASFVATTRDNLIEGIAHYAVDGEAAEERVVLNRRTGEIRNIVKRSKSARLLEGTCIRISGPVFGQETDGQ